MFSHNYLGYCIYNPPFCEDNSISCEDCKHINITLKQYLNRIYKVHEVTTEDEMKRINKRVLNILLK